MTKICFIGDIHGKVNSPSNYLSDYNKDLFEQLLWVKQYCEQNDIQNIIHLGDIFDKPEATDEWKNNFIDMWKSFNGTFYSIIGAAHDLFNNRASSYDRTCLKNLELSGVIKVLNNEQLDFGDVSIYALSPFLKEAKEQLKTATVTTKDNILVAHQFYEWSLNKESGFEKDDFENIKNNCNLILGHDHRQHETCIAYHTTVYRPGSFMRTELSETTINMIPRILIYDNGIFNYVDIPCKNIEEIYNVAEYRLKKAQIFKEIKNNIADVYNYLNKDSDILKCSDFLKEIDCPVAEFEYLRTVHQVSSLDF